jgi:hypothetical protein
MGTAPWNLGVKSAWRVLSVLDIVRFPPIPILISLTYSFLPFLLFNNLFDCQYIKLRKNINKQSTDHIGRSMLSVNHSLIYYYYLKFYYIYYILF